MFYHKGGEMDKKAFNRVVSAGELTWEQKNPIGFIYFPSNNGHHGTVNPCGSEAKSVVVQKKPKETEEPKNKAPQS